MSLLMGHQLEQSESVNEHIDQLVSAVELASSELRGPKDPDVDRVAENQVLVDEIGKSRGRPLFYPYVGTGLGRGPYVELEDGSIKLDLVNGIGIHILGHSHPEVIRASLRGSLSDMLIQGNLQANKEYLRLGERLVRLAGRESRLKYAWITTSGSMANENALKSCRQKKTPAKKVIAMEAAFAGRTTMMAEVTDNDTMRVGLPRYGEVLRVPFYDKSDPQSGEKSLQALRQHIDENPNDICAFMFELMQGEGGYKSAPREYFLPLLELCKEKEIPIWADEIQTFCRTGEFFAFETLGLGKYIDVCTIAKAVQCAATLYTEEFNPKPGLIAGTFAGSTPCLEAGGKILEILETQGYMGEGGRISQTHNEFIGMLNDLNETSCKGLLQDAGGLGLMMAVTPLDGSKEKVMKLLKVLYKNGLIAFACGRGPFRLRFLVPAIITSEDIQVVRSILEKSILEFH